MHPPPYLDLIFPTVSTHPHSNVRSLSSHLAGSGLVSSPRGCSSLCFLLSAIASKRLASALSTREAPAPPSETIEEAGVPALRAPSGPHLSCRTHRPALPAGRVVCRHPTNTHSLTCVSASPNRRLSSLSPLCLTLESPSSVDGVFGHATLPSRPRVGRTTVTTFGRDRARSDD